MLSMHVRLNAILGLLLFAGCARCAEEVELTGEIVNTIGRHLTG